LETSGEKSESPETITKVSTCALPWHSSMASTTRRMSALFLPDTLGEGISISSTAASWRSVMYSLWWLQSA
jgi:hypothetical protein